MTDETHTISGSRYLFHRWLIPLAVLGGIGGLGYVATEYFGLSHTDRLCGFAVAAFFAYYLWGKARIRFLKLTNGYYDSGSLKQYTVDNRGNSFPEPDFYEQEFFYDKGKQAVNVIVGLFMIGAAYFVISKKDVILPLIFFLLGLFFLTDAIRKLISGPVIKIAKQGIWTKESGFLSWKNIERIRFTDTSDQKTKLHSLDFFLKSNDEPKEFPDYTLAIQELKDEEGLKRMIAAYKPAPTLV